MATDVPRETEPRCTVYVRGSRRETAPGIWVGKVGGQCHREADWWANWTDTVKTTAFEAEQLRFAGKEIPEYRQIPMRTGCCGVHKVRIDREVEPFVDSQGQPVLVASWERIGGVAETKHCDKHGDYIAAGLGCPVCAGIQRSGGRPHPYADPITLEHELRKHSPSGPFEGDPDAPN